MKLPRFGFTPCVAVLVVLAEVILRHFLARSDFVAALLSARTAGLSWELLVAVVFVALRLFALWVLPPLLLTWVVARIWKRPG